MPAPTPSPRRGPLLALLALLALAAILAGCGTQARSTTTPRRGPPVRTPKVFVTSPAQALVSLHLYNDKSLMWQTIFVRRDGSGELTSLIGETAGAPQRPFRLPSRQLSRLHGLLAAATAGGARATAPAPLADGYIFSLHISGRPSENDGGTAPKPVANLIDYLSGLAFDYCC